jgi:hypothetical protein
MLEQVLTLISAPHSTAAALSSGLGALAGGVLWCCGSRFSRSLVTLLAVGLGAWIGLRLPGWLDLPISGWATATGGALGLGFLGYAMHRWWVSAGLVALLLGWAAVASYAAYDLMVRFPAWPEDMSPVDYAQAVAATMPPGLARLFPVACMMALVGGITIAFMWSRVAGYLFYSLLGASMFLVLGTMAMKLGRPSMLTIIPPDTAGQVLLLAGLSLFGVIVQWRMGPQMPSMETPAPPPQEKEEE